MPSPLGNCEDADFIELFEKFGAGETAKKLNRTERNIYRRRDSLERKIGRSINAPSVARNRAPVHHPHRIELAVRNGVVLVGSDGHYWPEQITTAHRAFVKFCKEISPVAVIMNGDAFDGARISRHPPIGWEDLPTVQQQIECTQDRLGEIEQAAGRARKLWPAGNHDLRFETRIALVAPELAKVKGAHLHDHFPLWETCWAVWINGDTVIKHRYKNGVHAVHNATVNSGVHTITGHLHSLKVTPFSDYNGTRFGVDTGTLAEPYGPQFLDYSEDNPRNHRSGFIVLTFVDGRLLWPEVVHVIEEGKVEFRGQIIEVGPCADVSVADRRSAAAGATPMRKMMTARNSRAAARTRKRRKPIREVRKRARLTRGKVRSA